MNRVEPLFERHDSSRGLLALVVARRRVRGDISPPLVHGFLMLARAAAFLGELGEGDRRRVLLDPTSEVFNARILRQLIEPAVYASWNSTAPRCRTRSIESCTSPPRCTRGSWQSSAV